MKSLVKIAVWLIIYLLPIVALIYYRAFIFTAEFNKPVDNVLNQASQSIGFKIPSYQLASNDASLYNQYLGDSNAPAQTEDSASSVATYQQPVSPSAPMLNQTIEAQDTEITEIDSAAYETEESGFNMKQIVTAVKESVSETLEHIMEEKESQPLQKESSLLSAQELLFKARLAYWNGD